MKKFTLMLAAAGMFGFAGSAVADPEPNTESGQSCTAYYTLLFKVDNSGKDKTESTGEAISSRHKDGTYNKDSTRGDEVSALNQLDCSPS